jgi:hypothetical protein
VPVRSRLLISVVVVLLAALVPTSPGAATAPRRAGTGTSVSGAGVSVPVVDVTRHRAAVLTHVRVHGAARVSAVRLSLADGPSDASDGGSTRIYPRDYNEQSATLTSGDARDGRWELRVRIPRHALPGDYHLAVRVTLRSGREVLWASRPVLTVRDRQPDVVEPVLTRMGRPVVDQQVPRDGRLRVRVRVTDERSGVDEVMVCWAPLSREISGFCGSLAPIGGDRRDGVWGADLSMRGMPLGEAELDVSVWDRGGLESTWSGPSHAGTPDTTPIPGGRGGFEVVERSGARDNGS